MPYTLLVLSNLGDNLNMHIILNIVADFVPHGQLLVLSPCLMVLEGENNIIRSLAMLLITYNCICTWIVFWQLIT